MIENPFSILGHRTEGSIEAQQLETFPAPKGVNKVRFESDELTAFCPITHQPDFYHVTIEYTPSAKCLESKALKLYLMSFRDRGMFAESLSAEIADGLLEALNPWMISVTLRQQARGGLTLTATTLLTGGK